MGDCGVCIGGDFEGEYADFSHVTYPKARKAHFCCECGREIAKGQQYERYAGKSCGDFYEAKTCLDCAHIRKGLSCNGGAVFGTLWDEIHYIFPEVTTGCLQRIKTPEAKAYFIERWNQWKFKQPVRTRDSGAKVNE